MQDFENMIFDKSRAPLMLGIDCAMQQELYSLQKKGSTKMAVHQMVVFSMLPMSA